MPKNSAAAQHQSMLELLKILRTKLAVESPVYMAVLTGVAIEDSEVIGLLATSIVGSSDAYLTFGFENKEVLLIFGYESGLSEGLKQLIKIALPIAKHAQSLFSGRILQPKLSSPDKKTIYSVLMTRLLADIARRREPESPLLPNFVSGKAALANDPRAAFPNISLPTGNVPLNPEYHQAWMAAQKLIAAGEVSVYVMKTSLITALTRTVKLLSDHTQTGIGKGIKATWAQRYSMRRKPPKMLDGPQSLGTLFSWKGKTAKLQPKPFALLKMVWDAPPKAITTDEALEKIWANKEQNSSLKNARDRINEALRKAGYPESLSIKGPTISLD
jgi:hypothetical protein